MAEATGSSPVISTMDTNKVVIVRPSRGKPSIHHMGEVTPQIKAAVEKHGWKDLNKLAGELRSKGFVVEMRLFKVKTEE